MGLLEFLRARLDEDELAARGIQRLIDAETDSVVYYDPARVLAEVEAKRRIIEHVDTTDVPGWRDTHAEMMLVLRLLALPYADHPDYDEGWKP